MPKKKRRELFGGTVQILKTNDTNVLEHISDIIYGDIFLLNGEEITFEEFDQLANKYGYHQKMPKKI